MAAPYLHETKDGVTLDVVLSPRASKNAILGEYNSRLKLSLTAPPVDGKANAALCKYLAKLCKVPASSVEIVRGHTSREKTVLFSGTKLENIAPSLE